MIKIRAPMAGVVFSVHVAEGANVAVGDHVLSLESMKMEIPVSAEEAGVVARVSVSIGDVVDQDDVLIELSS